VSSVTPFVAGVPRGVCRGHPVAGVFALGRARAGVGGRVRRYFLVPAV